MSLKDPPINDIRICAVYAESDWYIGTYAELVKSGQQVLKWLRTLDQEEEDECQDSGPNSEEPVS